MTDIHHGAAMRPAPEAEARIVGIEFLRFVSALSVLVWHYQHFAYSAGAITLLRSEQPFHALLFPFYEHGALGVQMFWCISGFIFFAKYHESLASGRASFRTFAVNRFSRLYPLHLLTLLLVAGLQPLYSAAHGEFFVYPFNDAWHFLLNALFISEWGLSSGHSFNAPIWSVSVELIVYGLFFLLVSKLPVARAYIGAGLFYLAFKWIGGGLVAQCLMYFFIGGAIALGRFFPERFRVGGLHLPTPFGMIGILLAVATAALLAGHLAGVRPLTRPSLVQPILITSVLFVFVAANRLFLPAANLLSFLGNLTYASYLCHFPIQLLIVLLLPLAGRAVDYRDPWLLAGFLITTFAIAALVFRTIELPAQRALRQRLLG